MIELSFDEVLVVSGAGDPSCLPGYEVQSYTHDGNGNITSVTCEPTTSTEIIQYGADVVGKVVDAIDTVGGWFGL